MSRCTKREKRHLTPWVSHGKHKEKRGVGPSPAQTAWRGGDFQGFQERRDTPISTLYTSGWARGKYVRYQSRRGKEGRGGETPTDPTPTPDRARNNPNTAARASRREGNKNGREDGRRRGEEGEPETEGKTEAKEKEGRGQGGQEGPRKGGRERERERERERGNSRKRQARGNPRTQAQPRSGEDPKDKERPTRRRATPASEEASEGASEEARRRRGCAFGPTQLFYSGAAGFKDVVAFVMHTPFLVEGCSSSSVNGVAKIFALDRFPDTKCVFMGSL